MKTFLISNKLLFLHVTKEHQQYNTQKEFAYSAQANGLKYQHLSGK
jgi:hypothetical protein